MGVRRAREARSAGLRFEEVLSAQMELQVGDVRLGKIEREVERKVEKEAGEEQTSSTYWTPFALVLVSHAPIYSILGDLVRISWAR